MGFRFYGLVFALGGLLALIGGPSEAQAPSRAPVGFAAEEDVLTAPVNVDGIDLFQVRGIRSYPAEMRAREIQRRIIAFAQDSKIPADAIVQVPGENFTEIVAGDKKIMVVFDADAALEGLDRPAMARAIQNLTREAVRKYRNDRRPEAIRRGLLKAVGASALLFFILFLFRWLFGKTRRLVLRKQEAAPGKVIKLRTMEIMEADRFWKGVAAFFSGLRLLLSLILLYVYLQFVLGQFPWTRFIATQLLDLVAGPLRTMGRAVIGYIPDFIFLVILILVIGLFLKFLKSLFISIERRTFSLPGFESEWARPTYRLLRIIIIALAVVIAYPFIPGSQSDAFKGVSIFMGLLLSLGSSSAIANIIAGYSLIYRRAFKVGDRIQINDVIGDVTQMRLLVTHLQTIKNEEVTVPNSLILGSHVINYSSLAKTQGLILHTTVGIGYETPWRQVEAILLRAAERTPGLLKEPSPFVLQKGLGDFAVNYEINAYCRDAQSMTKVYAELHRNILDEFNEYGIQIMTPAYEGDPATPKVVPKEKWFTTPASAPPPKQT